MVTTPITRTELNVVILSPINRFRENMLSVTKAIERPKERMILSMRLICRVLKNTKLQVKPGKKKTNINPRIALTTDTPAREGRIDLNSSASQSTSDTFLPFFSNYICPIIRPSSYLLSISYSIRELTSSTS